MASICTDRPHHKSCAFAIRQTLWKKSAPHILRHRPANQLINNPVTLTWKWKCPQRTSFPNVLVHCQIWHGLLKHNHLRFKTKSLHFLNDKIFNYRNQRISTRLLVNCSQKNVTVNINIGPKNRICIYRRRCVSVRNIPLLLSNQLPLKSQYFYTKCFVSN